MKKAKIYSYTVIHTSSVDFQDKTPYICMILEKENGLRFPYLSNDIKLAETLEIGQEISYKENQEINNAS